MKCNLKTIRINCLSVFTITALLLVLNSVPAMASDGYTGGYHATGVEDNVVYLNDLEDHTWTYYTGIDEDIDGTPYKEKYYSTNTLARIYSPGPRNVKVTYIGNGLFSDNDTYNTGTPIGVQVSTTETENTFVYFETLDRHDKGTETSDYFVYPVIPNPFSKRPSRQLYTDESTQSPDKTYYGCRKWYVESITGGTVIDSNGKTIVAGIDPATASGDASCFIMGDTDVRLIPNDVDGTGYTENCMSMEIVLKAYWEPADRVLINGTETINYSGLTKEHRELNFLVLNRTAASTISNGTVPVTVTMVEPDGEIASGMSCDYRTSSNYISSFSQGTGDLKIEYCYMNITGKQYIGTKHDLYLGRDLYNNTSSTGYTINQLRGTSVNTNNLTYRLRVESGIYDVFSITDGQVASFGINSSVVKVDFISAKIIFGSDYDRAMRENLHIVAKSGFCAGHISGSSFKLNDDDDVAYSVLIKSGTYYKLSSTNGMGQQSCYFSDNTGYMLGLRYVEVQNGDFTNFAGGWNTGGTSTTKPSLTFRIKGGYWNGCMYCAASANVASGQKYIVFTGGHIDGWISGGCNGLETSGGVTSGSSFIYIGGTSHVGDGKGNNIKINTSYGGNVYGAGSGNLGGADVGKMTLGTNVVISDNAVVEGDVFGGGNSGYTLQKANVTIAGGTVEHSVFGGSNQNRSAGEYANVLMVGGTVGGGVYGGCNESGTLKYDTSVRVKGGTVGHGTEGKVCGAGLGVNTVVTGDISVEIGSKPSDGTETGNKEIIDNLTIYGDVYGGSALGYSNVTPTVSGTTVTGSSPSGKSTHVKMYSGTVEGNVYGGALGSVSKPATIGATSQTIDIFGGRVTGGVFGGSNINASMTASARPRQGVTVHDTWTPTVEGDYAIGSVFGGGNGETAAASGQPGAHDLHTDGTFVTVLGGSVGNVFGGGNAATALKTTVSVTGGTVGNIYGGSNKADINGPTSISVSGDGTSVISGIYGGCNTLGNVSGTTSVSVLGGTIGREGALANIHGGGFGQNTTTADDVHVQIGTLSDGHGSTAGPVVYADIYGGSALGSVNSASASPLQTSLVDINSGSVYGNVYGGGLGQQASGDDVPAIAAVVNGNTLVNVHAAHFGPDSEVFGGNNLNGSPVGNTTVHVYETETPSYTAHITENQSSFPGESEDNPWSQYTIRGVYGGSNRALFHTADAPGRTEVIIDDCSSSIAYVYGGSNAADVYGSTSVTVNGAGKIGVVFGGGNGSGAGNPGANVLKGTDDTAGTTGNTVTNIYGGTVDFAFGGSNTLGDIEGTATVNLEKSGSCDDYLLGEVYGAGNAAPMHGTPVLNIGCIPGVGSIYGGARNADLFSDVTLNIHNGTYNKVFGGNNLGGTLDGAITVNIEETGCSPIVIGELYGCGNMAAYTTPEGKHDPIVNILSATSIGSVYGGGLGESATVTGSPTVSINMEPGILNKGKGTALESPQSLGTIGNVFGGGNAAVTVGSTTINLATVEGKDAPITGNVYGGGNLAAVEGSTTINAAGGSASKIFGGGNGDAENSKAADITGSTSVLLTGTTVSSGLYGGCNAMGTVGGSTSLSLTGGSVGTESQPSEGVFGGGYGEHTGVEGNVDVMLNGTPVYGDVYGGSALGSVNSDADDYTHVTLTSSAVSGNIYGGGLGDNTSGSEIAAVVNGDVAVTVSGGSAANVFGCNNLMGAPQNEVTVTITDGTVSGNVYGGGNLAAAAVSPSVTVTGGSMTNVYGGGLGSTAVITGSPTVSITKPTESALTVTDVFGGGDQAVTVGSTVINLATDTDTDAPVTGNVYGGGNLAAVEGSTTINAAGGSASKIFGGGNGDAENGKAADITGSTSVLLTGTAVSAGLYGGCNAMGTVGGSTSLSLTGGTVGTESQPSEGVFGGGYGEQTGVGGNVDVMLNGTPVYGDVYGGSALGSVNSDTDDYTHVTLTSSTVSGSVYGGGLGRKDDTSTPEDEAVAALVNGNVLVTMDGGTIGGSVFGCNNLNGSPAGTVQVSINRTAAHQASPLKYAVNAVYGGGNLADSDVAPHVSINGCDVSIGSVYGGGNAASTTGTSTVIWGGTIGNAFGGGNGIVSPADVSGDTSLKIHGGTITSVYAGSNTSGDITGYMTLDIDSRARVEGETPCDERIGEIYGGGNHADGNGATITIGCGSGYLGNVYGGARAARINTGLTLNIMGGQIDNVFGGNNEEGEINGDITVNIMTGDCDSWIRNVYGCGNMAPFSHNSTVNLISGTVGLIDADGTLQGGNVFGGGYGATATVTGNTTVNLCSDAENPSAVFEVLGSIYGGGDLAAVSGDATVNLTKGRTACAFGGGNKAVVNGNTLLRLNGADDAAVSVSSDLYGGGSLAAVNGSTHVELIRGTVGGNVYGGGLGQLASGDATPALAAIAADVTGTATVDVKGATLNNVFGCNNLLGAPQGTVTVNIDMESGSVGGSVYGGGNVAAYTGDATVNLTKGTVSRAFGGGLGETAIVTGSPRVLLTGCTVGDVFGGGDMAGLVGNPQLGISGGSTMRIFGGGNEALVTGDPNVTITGGTHGTVFGGGNAANVIGTTRVTVTGADTRITGNVFGGGNQGDVSGSPVVTVGGATM